MPNLYLFNKPTNIHHRLHLPPPPRPPSNNLPIPPPALRIPLRPLRRPPLHDLPTPNPQHLKNNPPPLPHPAPSSKTHSLQQPPRIPHHYDQPKPPRNSRTTHRPTTNHKSPCPHPRPHRLASRPFLPNSSDRNLQFLFPPPGPLALQYPGHFSSLLSLIITIITKPSLPPSPNPPRPPHRTQNLLPMDKRHVAIPFPGCRGGGSTRMGDFEGYGFKDSSAGGGVAGAGCAGGDKCR